MFIVFVNGCSVSHALNAPEPVEYKKIYVGLNRSAVISRFGIPKLTENKEDEKVDFFEFVDGYHAASKIRILLYLAGDVFTAGLAELIFWPIEKGLFDGNMHRGVVKYDKNERVKKFEVFDNEGKKMWSK